MAHEIVFVAAYSAGIVVVFSPCATALLPAYLSYYMSRKDDEASSAAPTTPRLVRAGLAGLVAGFALLVVALVDYVVSFGDRAATDLAVFFGGSLALALGGFATWEGTRTLELGDRIALRRQLFRGLLVGGAASLGIGAVYVGLGLAVILAIRFGLQGFQGLLPRIAFGSAAVVVVLGVLMIFDKGFASVIPGLRGPRGRNAPAFFLFGAGYGLIASGCFLPVFLQVVSASLILPPVEAAQVLVAYALGSATIFMLITMSAGVARGAALRALRAWRPYVHRIAGGIVVAMGAYVLWFDWTFLLSQGL